MVSLKRTASPSFLAQNSSKSIDTEQLKKEILNSIRDAQLEQSSGAWMAKSKGSERLRSIQVDPMMKSQSVNARLKASNDFKEKLSASDGSKALKSPSHSRVLHSSGIKDDLDSQFAGTERSLPPLNLTSKSSLGTERRLLSHSQQSTDVLSSDLPKLKAQLMRSISKHAKEKLTTSGKLRSSCELPESSQRRPKTRPPTVVKDIERPIFKRVKRHLEQIKMPSSLPNHNDPKIGKFSKRFSCSGTPYKVPPRLTRQMNHLDIEHEDSLEEVKKVMKSLPHYSIGFNVDDIICTNLSITNIPI